MPGFATHHIFGVNAYHRIPDINLKNIIKKHKKAYALGLQGPDLFFYFFPTSAGLKVKIANKLHKEKTDTFMKELINACRTVADEDSFETNVAYICGFVGHYILDTSVHPYVYHRVGTRSSKETLGIHFGLETDIDREVLLHYCNRKMTDFDHRKAINVSKSETISIAKLLHKAILSTYDEDLTISLIKAAIGSFKLESALIMDKNNHKQKIFSFLETHTLKHEFLTPLLINEVEHMEDPCNTEHKEWSNPWDGDFSSDESVFDIMDKKANEYASAMVLMSDALKKAYNNIPDSNPLIIKTLGRLSYTSGLDWEIPISRD